MKPAFVLRYHAVVFSTKSFFAIVIVGSSNAALAGSLISTNLPTNTWIVNVDGRNDGASSYDGDQSSWFQPFAVNGQLNEITLGPGTYSFDLIDQTDAAKKFTNLTGGQLSTIGSGWTYNSPWITDYFVFDSSATTDGGQKQLFAGATGGNGYGNGEDAYHAALAGGYSNRLYTGPGGRIHGVEAYDYTLTKEQTLIFVVPDYALGDNNGSISVVVTKAVPEPASILGLSAGVLALLRRRRR